ncbi:MAG: branched-chain amino acid ABC transporter permease [Candidatus Caldarchaeum sp.]|nr:branched-chain amino acid ABC transporter permease [Candidatus Caldarchaeum sp.]
MKKLGDSSTLPVLGLLAFLLFFPLVTPLDYPVYVIALTFLFGTVALNLDLTLGRLGMFNLAHSAIFGVGGYTSAMLAKYLGFPVPLTIFLGGAAACLISLPIGLIGLRLAGAYFAIATLALSEVLRLTYLRLLDDWTYGESGLWGIPPFPDIVLGNFTINLSASLTAQYYLFMLLLIVNIVIYDRLLKTRIGLYFTAIREDELAAKSLAIDTLRYKLLGFLLSSFFTGLAGGVYAHWIRTFSPALMSIPQSVFFVAMVLIGGVRTLSGPLAGAFVSVIIFEFLKVRFIGMHMITFGLLIILITLAWPDGIISSIRKIYGKPISPSRR